MGGWFKRHKILTGILLFVLLVWGFVAWRMWGPYRFYEVDYIKTGQAESGSAFLVGVGKREITPDLSQYDTWTDANDDGRYKEEDGDTWQDTNGNGEMNLVWIGGFSNNRPAKGVNDPLWARAIAVQNNGVTVVMVAIDSVGMTHERFIKVRESLDPGIADHVILATTHSHEAPDTMGIWSYKVFPSYFDDAYMAFIQSQAKLAIEDAVASLKPAEMILQEKEVVPEGWVRDSREPLVYDLKVCMARFVEPGTDITRATLVSWGNHPESMGSDNNNLSSDYVHYFREGVEKGIEDPNGATGLGGTCIFFSGPLGGLMNPLHIPYTHRDGTTVVQENSLAKAEILGANLALLVVNAFREENLTRDASPRVAVAARTVYLPMSGLFKYAIALGLIHPGYYWGKSKSEIDMVRIGELEILTIPGEIYPEIVDGGVESPTGADFGIDPQEVPPLRSQMKGKVNMVFNLANDEIGYIVPKSQWDTEEPFTYDNDDAPYGEENSGGYDVAPTVHREALKLMEDFHAALGE